MGKKSVYFPERDIKGRPWWQSCTVKDFQEALASMETTKIEALDAEIEGALEVLETHLETRGRSDRDWWNRANLARSFIQEKQYLVEAALKQRKGGKKPSPRRSKLTELREQAGSGETQEALVGLLDWLLGKESA